MKMPLFGCRTCQSKDETIKHLIWVIDRLEGSNRALVDRLSEVQSPGAVARSERPKQDAIRRDNAPPPRRRNLVQTLPGYEPEFQEEVEIV
jgi:hypothetical protein